MDRPAKTKSFRSTVYSSKGMCATSQPLATLTGIEILKHGGSAADAAIGMLNTLTVVEPFMTGLGGDMFGLYFNAEKNELVGLNASGPAPMGLNMEIVKSKGFHSMPLYGPMTITVPGALAGLDAFHKKFGKIAWEDLFQDAIAHAEMGFPVPEIISYHWQAEEQLLKQYKETADIYLRGGKAPRPGEIFINKPLASTLKMVASEGIDTFYKGELSQKICRPLLAKGSFLTPQDLYQFQPEWVDPISINYEGRDIFELPPNSQGITVLEMLRLIDGFDLRRMGLNTSDYIHALVEAKKFAFHDRDSLIGDPRYIAGDFNQLLSNRNIDSFKKRYNPNRASDFRNNLIHSATVYVTAVDQNRNAASFISSIFEHFGSGLVAGETGILMQNRGSLFTLIENHPNCLHPGKRPLHTIIPSIVFKDGKPEFVFGLMGGHMQPQGHVQILNNLYVFGLGVQEASDQPRFFHDGLELCLESSFSSEVRRELIEKGHKLNDQVGVFGGFQGIWIDHHNGALIGGSDLRKDGCAIGY